MTAAPEHGLGRLLAAIGSWLAAIRSWLWRRRVRPGAGAKLADAFCEWGRARVPVLDARRTAGEAAQRARTATGFSLDQLTERLDRTRDALELYEAGNSEDDGSLGERILDVLDAVASRTPPMGAALDALYMANGELRKRMGPLKIAERKLAREVKAVTSSPPEEARLVFEAANSELVDRRKRALQQARNAAEMKAQEFADALNARGVRTRHGMRLDAGDVYAAESTSRKHPRRPTQEYVNGTIDVLETSASPQKVAEALDELRSTNVGYLDLESRLGAVVGSGCATGSQPPKAGRSRRWAIAGAAGILVVGVIVAVILNHHGAHPHRSQASVVRSRPEAPVATISTPGDGAQVSSGEFVRGTASRRAGPLLWLVVEPQVHHAYHPQQHVDVVGGAWSGFAYFGDEQTPTGTRFALDLVAVTAAGSRAFEDYLHSLPRLGALPYPGLRWLPAGAMVLAQVVVTRG